MQQLELICPAAELIGNRAASKMLKPCRCCSCCSCECCLYVHGIPCSIWRYFQYLIGCHIHSLCNDVTALHHIHGGTPRQAGRRGTYLRRMVLTALMSCALC